MKPVIIMIGGKARNGKSEIADTMLRQAQEDDKKGIIIGLADYLKWVCNHYIGVPIEGHSEDQRWAWQTFGTDMVKACDPSHWVRETEFMIRKTNECEGYDYVFIPDFRFPDEAEYFEQYAYTVYTIYAERIDNPDSLQGSEAEHSSENSLENYTFDFQVVAKTLKELRKQACEIYKEIANENPQG